MSLPTADDLIDSIASSINIDRDKLSPETPLTSLGVDSIGVVEMAFALEDKYGIEIELNANTLAGSESALSTVQDVVNMVQGLISRQVPA
jgi:acyl carrier protein